MRRIRRLTLAIDDPDLRGRVVCLLASPERPAAVGWRYDDRGTTADGGAAGGQDGGSESGRDAVGRDDLLITDQSAADRNPVALGIGSRAAGSTIWLPFDAPPQRFYEALEHLCQWLDRRDELDRLRSERQALIEQARLDPLTGLANRQAWNETLSERVQESQSTGRSLVVALIDLDAFKQVNEQLGLSSGDDWLIRAAAVLQRRLAEFGADGSLAARWGGDEFAVLFWSDAGDQVARRVDGLRTALAARHESRDPSDAAILTTASAGWAISSSATRLAADELFSRAEAALRTAKRLGGNRTLGPG